MCMTCGVIPQLGITIKGQSYSLLEAGTILNVEIFSSGNGQITWCANIKQLFLVHFSHTLDINNEKTLMNQVIIFIFKAIKIRAIQCGLIIRNGTKLCELIVRNDALH